MIYKIPIPRMTAIVVRGVVSNRIVILGLGRVRVPKTQRLSTWKRGRPEADKRGART